MPRRPFGGPSLLLRFPLFAGLGLRTLIECLALTTEVSVLVALPAQFPELDRVLEPAQLNLADVGE